MPGHAVEEHLNEDYLADDPDITQEQQQ